MRLTGVPPSASGPRQPMSGRSSAIMSVQSPAARNDGVGPGVLTAAVRLLKTAFFLVAGGARLDQGDGALFAADVEVAIGVRDRTLADTAILPGNVAVLEVHAQETVRPGAV